MEMNYFFAGAGIVAGFTFGWWLLNTISSHTSSIDELECEMEILKDDLRWKERNYNEELANIRRSMVDPFNYLEQRVSKLEEAQEAQKSKKQVIYEVKD